MNRMNPANPVSCSRVIPGTLLYLWFMTLATVARHHHHTHAILRRAVS